MAKILKRGAGVRTNAAYAKQISKTPREGVVMYDRYTDGTYSVDFGGGFRQIINEKFLEGRDAKRRGS